MAIFGHKPWVNPFVKMAIFRLFELLVFIAWRGDLTLQNIIKDLFPPYISLKKQKNWKKIAIFRPKPWVNPFGKMSIFRLFQLVVFIAEKGVFSFQNIVKDILLAYITLKKIGKMAIFGPKLRVNPLWKNINFSNFKTSCFYSLERRFFVLE